MVVGRFLKLNILNFSFLSMATAFPAMAIAKPVSLDEAVQAAINNTETIPLGESRLQQAEARVDQGEAAFWPSVSLGASYQQQDTGGILTRQSSSLFGGRQSFTRLTLSQSLFEGGRNLATLNSSQADRERREHQLQQSKQAVYASVARSFFLVQANRAEVVNLNEAIRLARDRVKEINNREKIGRSRNIESLSARAQLSVLEAQLMAAEGQLVTAHEEFSLMTGLPRDVELVSTVGVPSAPESLEGYLKTVEERPDVLALKAELEMVQALRRGVRAGHWPSVALLGNYYFSREGTQKGNDWDVGVTMNFPLFLGGMVSAQNREVHEREAEVQLLIAQARRQAENVIRTAYNNLSSSLSQLRVLQEALLSTERSYQLNARNYRFGQATNLEVIQALNSYQETKRTLDRTRFQALMFGAELKAATSSVFSLEKKGEQ